MSESLVPTIKNVLRHLTISVQHFPHLVVPHLCRVLFSGSEGQAQLVEESIKHAKEAVMLDIRDGNSWCKNLFIQNNSCICSVSLVSHTTVTCRRSLVA